ncbi:AAA family ATPase [Rhodosalinus sediminis]|uniref:AAA family ATPase n=1 Tax=Rhodosalinus sediminis TaxID=1940533 RepID=UPI0023551F68|nr:AAA family ATPase [Rhodosalinus sediminis]
MPTTPSPARAPRGTAARPDWLAFARELLRALADDPLTRETLWPDGLSPAADAALADIRPPEEVAEMLAAGEDPFRVPAEPQAGAPETPAPPRATALQALLRLCAAVPDAAALEDALLRPGAVTLIETGDAGLTRALSRLVPVLPAVRRAPLQPVIHCAEDALSARAPQPDEIWPELARELREALESHRPVVLIAPGAARLPRALAALAPRAIRLPPLGGDILLEHLRLSHARTGRIAEDLVRAQLPPDDQLARLRIEDLALALRHPTPAAVAARLAATCAPRDAGPRFADFPIPAAARAPLEQMLADLADWQAGRLPWSDVTRGVLLAGPPGTGKTEIARLLAREAGVAFEAGSLAEWAAAGRAHEMIAAMRAFFARAAAAAPAIAFIDELDAVDTRDRAPDQNSAYTAYVVNALIESLDGVAGNEGVVFLGATNHPARIDPAVRRPGRFDWTLEIPAPGPELLPEVLRYHLRGDLAAEDLSGLAARLVGRSGADVAALVRRARARARGARRALARADLEAAVDASAPPMPASARRRIALHEAGHAVVATATGCARPTVLALTGGGGLAEQALAGDVLDLAGVDALLAMLLAGRAAEGLVLGAPSHGAGGGPESDLAVATRLAAAVEAAYGLGRAGPLWRAGPEDAVALLRGDPEMRAAVTRRLERAETRARRILAQNRACLERLAEALTRTPSLHGDALAAHLAPVAPETEAATLGPQLH